MTSHFVLKSFLGLMEQSHHLPFLAPVQQCKSASNTLTQNTALQCLNNINITLALPTYNQVCLIKVESWHHLFFDSHSCTYDRRDMLLIVPALSLPREKRTAPYCLPTCKNSITVQPVITYSITLDITLIINATCNHSNCILFKTSMTNIN